MRRFLLVLVTLVILASASIQKAVCAAETSSIESTNSSAEPLTCQLTLDKKEVSIGEPITVSWVISGGDAPPYTYYEWNSGWVVYEANQTEHQFIYGTVDGNTNSWVPAYGSRAYFYLSLLDANGKPPKNPEDNSSISFKTEEIQILNAEQTYPLEIKFTLDRTKVDVGKTITSNWNITGGKAPYKISTQWSIYEQEGEIFHKSSETEVTSSTFVPMYGKSGRFLIEVTDADGRYKWEPSLTFEIIGSTSISDEVSEVVSQCNSSTDGSSYAKVKWLHDYLVRNAKYDYTYAHYAPHGVLLLGTGVCNSYATAFQLLLNKAGINNKFISAEANNGSGWEGHAWNLVSIGGNCYHVDVTWDDGSGSTRYFLKSDQSMSADHRWDASKYPACPYNWGKAPAGNLMPGDANADNTIDIMDLVSIIDYIVSETPTVSMPNADANGDGLIDIMDLVWIIDRIVNS